MNKLEKQFDEFDSQIKEMTLDRMNEAPNQEIEAQTKLSQKEIQNSKDIFLKPKRRVSSKEKFNEKFRQDYEFQKETVHFIAENKEVIGEAINLWTKPFAGMPAEEWIVPVNTPVWGPRYLAEQIKRKYYHRLTMKQTTTSADGMGNYYGKMVADTTIPRLTAAPVSDRKSIFMGKHLF